MPAILATSRLSNLIQQLVPVFFPPGREERVMDASA